MNELLEEFKKESGKLVNELEELLDELEEDFANKEKLNEFAQLIDRIMGSSQSLVSFGFEQSELKKLGDFAELCKQIGYRGINITEKSLYEVTIAFLWDAVESMKKLLESIDAKDSPKSISKLLVSTFISRLKWILEQFEAKNILMEDYTKSGDVKLKSKDEINDLLSSIE